MVAGIHVRLLHEDVADLFFVVYDENSFVVSGAGSAQAVGTGCAKKPVDVAVAVQDATGAALKAIQAMVRS